jgi:phosphoribosyl 1,2-cyclic phosphate phosphodiesterase
MGTPVVTCDCSVCHSTDSRDHRLRPSGLLRLGEQSFLLDAGPDFRAQALKYNIRELSGVILTHMHYDHIGGMDDLRVFYFFQKQTLPCLLSNASYEEMQKIFPYFFDQKKDDVMGGPRFRFHVFDKKDETVNFCNLTWRTVCYQQYDMQVSGYRIGYFAYVMDLKSYDNSIFKHLQGIETLVISGLRYRASPAHLTLEEAMAFARKVGAKKTWFSHISHELPHEKTNQELPPDMQLAYDGLQIELSY